MSTTTATAKPILFSAPMVRALLEGRKTMTRRVMKPQPQQFKESPFWRWKKPGCKVGPFAIASGDRPGIFAPYVPGDRLWVREAWRANCDGELSIDVNYRADDTVRTIYTESLPDSCIRPSLLDWQWKPSIHMPRWASRITLEITSVKVERVQSISEADAQAEGLTEYFWDDEAKELPQIKPQIEAGQRWWNHVIVKRSRRGSVWDCPIKAFRELWNDINGKGSWEANPWVWVVCFRRNDA